MTPSSIPIGLKKGGVLCLLRSGDALLLLRRTKALHHGQYVPVGGHIDPFESPRDAALREVREEAGVALGDVTFCGVMVETSPTKYNWVTFIYLADVERFDPPPCVEGALEWIPISRLPDIPTPPNDAHIYRLALAGRRFVFDITYDEALNVLAARDELSGEALYGEGEAPPGAVVGGDSD